MVRQQRLKIECDDVKEAVARYAEGSISVRGAVAELKAKGISISTATIAKYARLKTGVRKVFSDNGTLRMSLSRKLHRTILNIREGSGVRQYCLVSGIEERRLKRYKCQQCFNLRATGTLDKVPVIHVREGKIEGDIHPVHDHRCKPLSVEEVIAVAEDRESRLRVRQGLQQPKAAFNEGFDRIVQLAKNSGESASRAFTMSTIYPSWNRVAHSYYRARRYAKKQKHNEDAEHASDTNNSLATTATTSYNSQVSEQSSDVYRAEVIDSSSHLVDPSTYDHIPHNYVHSEPGSATITFRHQASAVSAKDGHYFRSDHRDHQYEPLDGVHQRSDLSTIDDEGELVKCESYNVNPISNFRRTDVIQEGIVQSEHENEIGEDEWICVEFIDEADMAAASSSHEVASPSGYSLYQPVIESQPHPTYGNDYEDNKEDHPETSTKLSECQRNERECASETDSQQEEIIDPGTYALAPLPSSDYVEVISNNQPQGFIDSKLTLRDILLPRYYKRPQGIKKSNVKKRSSKNRLRTPSVEQVISTNCGAAVNDQLSCVSSDRCSKIGNLIMDNLKRAYEEDKEVGVQLESELVKIVNKYHEKKNHIY